MSRSLLRFPDEIHQNAPEIYAACAQYHGDDPLTLQAGVSGRRSNGIEEATQVLLAHFGDLADADTFTCEELQAASADPALSRGGRAAAAFLLGSDGLGRRIAGSPL